MLLKFARLYGLEHTRSADQFNSTWVELQQCVQASRDTGLLLGASGSQLLLNGEPLESTPAERSFADLLTTAGVASIGFNRDVEREEFANLVRAFMETGPKAVTLSERLEKYFGAKQSGIRVNEIRFVAEDAGFGDARVAAQLAVKTLGGEAERIQDWFRSPEKMIQLIAAAEGSHGGTGTGAGGPGSGGGDGSGVGGSGSGGEGTGPGLGTGFGFGTGMGTGSGGSGSGVGTGAGMAGAGAGVSGAGPGSGAGGPGGAGTGAGTGVGAGTGIGSAGGSGSGGGTGFAGSGAGGAGGVGGGGGGVAIGGSGAPGELPILQEAELHSLLRLLAQFGEASQSKNPSQLDQELWQQRLAALPQNAQVTLRQALASVAAQTPSAKVDEAMLLRLAEDLAIRFALDRFQRGEVRVNAVRQMLDRMGQELDTLRKLLKSREEKMATAGLSIESHADVLDRQFWAAVPDSGKRAVLSSPEAWCIPPRNVQQYVEELLGRGEAEAAGDILLHYASCVKNKDAEARKKAAIGLGQLAELYSKGASQRLQGALLQIGQQMAVEKDAELQTLLSAAFVRLSQESASRRYYRAMQQALDSLADLEEMRPSWAASLRPRTGIENRLGEFIEEALTAEETPEGFLGVLMRLPQVSAEQLATRLARSGKCSEREKVVEMATAVGAPCARHLKDTLRNEPAAKAATVVGLLSRLDAVAVEDILPTRLREGGRTFHDTVVRQVSTAGAPERGRILANSIEAFDSHVLPLALDEIGMCGDPGTAPKLLRLAEGDLLPEGPEYLRVKAIEALGRLRAPAAIGHLRRFIESRKTFGWAYPEEIRTAAAQALMKLDPEWMQSFLPQSGLDPKVLALAPLDPIPERDFVRHRRYRRIRLPRTVPAVITSSRGKYSSGISVLSLEGGLLSGDIQLAVGTEATLKIPAGLRSISMQAVVRFVRSHQAGFEMVGMGLEDRTKLRRLLVSLGGVEGPGANEVFPSGPAPTV
ncbi:MAG TPA: PilZ domain-containing protein [Candidatus Limnocylindrales bacterium]|nr:PilZ domain-containing protein [Candidatus Limnocylindrales bacterium]